VAQAIPERYAGYTYFNGSRVTVTRLARGLQLGGNGIGGAHQGQTGPSGTRGTVGYDVLWYLLAKRIDTITDPTRNGGVAVSAW